MRLLIPLIPSRILAAIILALAQLIPVVKAEELSDAFWKAERAAAESPSDPESHIARSDVFLALGLFERALASADRALALDPASATAVFAKVEALYLLGETASARTLAIETLENDEADFRRGARGALVGILVSHELRHGRLGEAERLLRRYYPSLADVMSADPAKSFESLAAPLHPIQYLAIICEATGREDDAAALRSHIAFLNEDYLASRSGGALTAIDAWMLASIGYKRLSDEDAIAYLERAWDGGFKIGWRYNYAQHATLWPYRDHPRYKALIERIENETASTRKSLQTAL